LLNWKALCIPLKTREKHLRNCPASSSALIKQIFQFLHFRGFGISASGKLKMRILH